MTIIATCGHEVEDVDDLVNTALRGYTRKNERCIDFVTLCADCYAEYKTDDMVLYTHKDELTWLGITNEQTT